MDSNNRIANVGDCVRYTGEVDPITGIYMKQYLIPGTIYEVLAVSVNYGRITGNNYYRFTNSGCIYWFAYQCFDILTKKEVIGITFGLR